MTPDTSLGAFDKAGAVQDIVRKSLVMRSDAAHRIGQDLKTTLEQIKVLAKQERAAHGPDAEALEIAIVNLDCAIEILTE